VTRLLCQGLKEFRNWMYSAEQFDFSQQCSDAALVAARREFAAKHAKIRRTWEVDAQFPSDAVIEAFLKPTVDSSEEAFEWWVVKEHECG
jgi:hypothetical protein